MKLLAIPTLALGLLGSVCAQSLTTRYEGTTFLDVGQVIFDLQVATTVTLHGLDVNCASDAGTAGTIEVWLTNPGTTTFLGNEVNASLWSLVSSGACTAQGPDVPSPVCLGTPVTLAPGSYGVAINYVGLAPLYTAGNGSVSPGGGGPTTNQFYSNSELTLLAGAAQGAPFTAPTNIPRVFNGTLIYSIGTTATPCSGAAAVNEKYGDGCYRDQGALWDGHSAATASALAGATMSLLPTGTGYLVLQGLGAAYIPPTAAATTLTGFVPDNDDGELQVTLPSPLIVGDGSVALDLWVHNNGMVSTGPNHASFAFSYFPQLAEFLAAPNTGWYMWHDYNIVEGGAIKTELVGNLFCITWEDVESYPIGTANPSTIQFQFDLSTGQVNYIFQAITATQAGAASDLHLMGFATGGPSLDHGEDDVTTVNNRPLSMVADRLPLTLDATNRPLLGNTVSYTTSNETTNPGLGVMFLATGQIPAPGIDLGIIGAGGCAALVDINTGVGSVISNLLGFSMTVDLPIPLTVSLADAELFAQSIWLDPAQNAFGILTSNGVRTHVGTF